MTASSPHAAVGARAAFPWVTLVVALFAVGVAVWPGNTSALEYERDAVRHGEWWRLWTSHFVHFGASHLIWNLAVLLPAAAWSERLSPQRARLLLLLGPGFIGGALYILDPALQRYAGLSGVAAALLAFLALTQLSRGTSDRWFWAAVLLLLAVKVIAEFLAERPLFARFVEPGAYPVPLAHLVGIMAAGAAHTFGRRIQNRAR